MAKKVGRPPRNDPDDVAAIKQKIDAYFNGLGSGEESRPPTFNGLALALGYCSRTTLWENANSKSSISEPIKVAMSRIEEAYETRLHGNSPTGAIFALKNRGWTDSQSITLAGDESKPLAFKLVDPPNASA